MIRWLGGASFARRRIIISRMTCRITRCAESDALWSSVCLMSARISAQCIFSLRTLLGNVHGGIGFEMTQ